MYYLLQEGMHQAVQHAEESGGAGNILSPSGGLMVWTLVIFLVLLFILTKFAFKPITKAVEDREQALQDAIDAAQRDREAAAQLLSTQRAQLEAARDEAQRILAEGRVIGEQLRAKMLDETRGEQQDLLARARREIEAERDKAIADMRREAVDLAIMGASKVIDKNMDDKTNRSIVESFLASIPAEPRTRG